MSCPGRNRRRHERYHIGPDDPVSCQFRGADWRRVTVLDESYSGCSLIMEEACDPEIGETVFIDFGHGYTVEAQILRVSRISARIVHLGCRFIQ